MGGAAPARPGRRLLSRRDPAADDPIAGDPAGSVSTEPTAEGPAESRAENPAEQAAPAVPGPERRRARIGLAGLFAGGIVSALGSQVSSIAIPWLVLTTTGDPAQMGLVIAARMIPYLLAGIFGTPLADRIGIKRSAVIADLVSMACVAVIAAVPGVGVPLIMAMVAVTGAVRGVGDRTRAVLLRPITETAGANLARMTALNSGIANGSMLIGAPIGGVLVAWLGAQQALWFDVVSYPIAVVILVLFVHPPEDRAPKRAAPERYLTSVAGGLRFLGRDRLLLVMVVMTFTANAANQANSALFVPLWVQETLGSPTLLGTVFGAFAAGAVVGNLVLIGLAPKLPKFVTFAVCLAFGGAPRLLTLAFSDEVALVLAVTFVSGFAMSGVNPILGVLLYERVPNELQTRVFGVVATVCFAGFPLGGVLGGWAVAWIGLTGALVAAAACYLLVTVVPLAGARRVAHTPPTTTGPAST